MKWGRHLIAKVYTRPFPPAFLCRPGATFTLQSPVLVDGPSSCVSDHGLSPGGWRRGKLIVGGAVQNFLWLADLSQPVWLRSDLPRSGLPHSDLPRSGALLPHRPDLICRDLTCSDLIRIPSDRLYGTPQERDKKVVAYLQEGCAPGGNWAGAYLHPEGLDHPKKAWKWPVAYLQEGCATGEELGCGIPSHRKQGTIKNAVVLARGIP